MAWPGPLCHVCLRPTILYPHTVAWNRLALSLIMHHPPCATHHTPNINFIGCWLCIAHYLLLIMHCSSFVAYWLSCIAIICCLSCIVHRSLLIDYHALLIVCCIPCTACYILCIAYHAELIILLSICSATSIRLLKMRYSSKVWREIGRSWTAWYENKTPYSDKYAALQVKADDGGMLNTSIQLCPGLPWFTPNYA